MTGEDTTRRKKNTVSGPCWPESQCLTVRSLAWVWRMICLTARWLSPCSLRSSSAKDLLTDESFLNLLRAEGLATMPRALAMRISGEHDG